MKDAKKTKEMVGVRFVSGVKVYHFDPGSLDLKRGDYVVVESQQGHELARVVYEKRDIDTDQLEEGEVMKILRVADDDDKKNVIEFFKNRISYLEKAKKMSLSLGLKVRFLDVSQSLDKNRRLLFLFSADGRVDFRELINQMTKSFNCPIRLYQVGPRDAARIVGGIGLCGQDICCRRFLNRFESITMEMARDQDLINVGSGKISGVCGKLLCCLDYELDLYKELKKNLPSVGDLVKTVEGNIGVVKERNVLMQTVAIEMEENKIRKVFPSSEVKVVEKSKR